ncbi:serine dehydratase alpha chain-domain-containing protein [Hypoxylon trugodes]|uniref:serine dehydratase alpha chain-domain-containing protein n=1 Tax=Hypoxylon trugodes TaxID=326681 RepID=UPI00218DB992|nr:serine dehydratase alpha chain-domain-containing protein [Hypoxylon trugodes]KAI1384065.1 serine dehydratase alpha chain-domain-containing protein [Hypoxylon trugodes]
MSRAAVRQLNLLRNAAGVASRRLASIRSINIVGTTPRIWRRAVLNSPYSLQTRRLSTAPSTSDSNEDAQSGTYSEADHEHAVISTFDLFSIGIGPSSSHTVGPMRAGGIFVADLVEAGLLDKVHKIRISIYGSLALTGEGHMTPSALLLGLESADVESVDTSYVPIRFAQIKEDKKLFLGHGLPEGKGREIDFDYDRDFKWEWGKKLPLHSNGMRFMVFDDQGMMLATNDFFSVGGGFVVNGALSTAATAAASKKATENALADTKELQTEGSGGHPLDLAENLFYKEIRRADAAGDRRTGSEIKPLDDEPADVSTALLETNSQTSSRPPVTSSVSDTDAGGTDTASQQPRYAFRDARNLLALCNKHNLTIAQLVYENEKGHGYTDDEIYKRVMRIWEVMDNSILEGVQAPLDTTLPGSLKLHRRAPALYKRLTRGLYPSHTQTPAAAHAQAQLSAPDSKIGGALSPGRGVAELPKSETTALSRRGTRGKRGPPRVHGSIYHPIMPSPPRRTTFPAMDYLTVYAIAVNETNAAGGRIVTAPTNGAAGIIPAVLKYTVEFISDDPERDILTFLLTAAAIGMLYKRGATISAAEGGCMAEVGVACSMAAGAFAACMGATPETIEQAAEIGIEHNLGLTCDPIGGLVQAPCIERNALGAIKAISSANLALSSEAGTQKVRLDDAIRAMRLTAQGMRNEFKETSLSGLATSVPLNIPVSVPDC